MCSIGYHSAFPTPLGLNASNSEKLKIVFGGYFAALASSPVSLGYQPATLSISGEGYKANILGKICDKHSTAIFSKNRGTNYAIYCCIFCDKTQLFIWISFSKNAPKPTTEFPINSTKNLWQYWGCCRSILSNL